ncbi:hypothetical protein ACLKA7_016373 [Drosophila subpalustris]
MPGTGSVASDVRRGNDGPQLNAFEKVQRQMSTTESVTESEEAEAEPEKKGRSSGKATVSDNNNNSKGGEAATEIQISCQGGNGGSDSDVTNGVVHATLPLPLPHSIYR